MSIWHAVSLHVTKKNSSYIAPKFNMRSKVRTRPYAGAFCQLMRLPPESWWRPSPKGILYAVLWWMQYWQASQKFCKKTRTVNWLLPSTPGFASSGWRSIITTSSAGNRWHQNCHGDSPESSEWTAAPTSVLKIRKNFFTSVTQPQLSKRHGSLSLKSKAKNLVWRPAWRLARKVLTDFVFLGEKVLTDLFIKYTQQSHPVLPPSSCFSYRQGHFQGQVKRATMSDASFEADVLEGQSASCCRWWKRSRKSSQSQCLIRLLVIFMCIFTQYFWLTVGYNSNFWI